jgi:hypothetical protein
LTAKRSRPTVQLAANLMGVGELCSEIDDERIKMKEIFILRGKKPLRETLYG